jgi:hypothetical protein
MNDLDSLRKRQTDLYVKIADASGEDVLNSLLDEVWELEDQIGAIENPQEPPLSKEEFESDYHIQREYERFHDEYGDAASLYSDYLEYHYQNYLKYHKNGWYYSF